MEWKIVSNYYARHKVLQQSVSGPRAAFRARNAAHAASGGAAQAGSIE
jgi:hypothetical protein